MKPNPPINPQKRYSDIYKQAERLNKSLKDFFTKNKTTLRNTHEIMNQLEDVPELLEFNLQDLNPVNVEKTILYKPNDPFQEDSGSPGILDKLKDNETAKIMVSYVDLGVQVGSVINEGIKLERNFREFREDRLGSVEISF